MSTTKGRTTVKDRTGSPIFRDTVSRQSAAQGILVAQDAMTDQVNAIQTALNTAASALASAPDIAGVNAAATALAATLAALAKLNKVDLK